MRVLLCMTAALFLFACNPAPGDGGSASAEQTIYQVEGDYAAALQAELAYSKLPRCGKPTSPKLCSQVSVIKKLQAADDVAWAAIKNAQKAVRTPGFGESNITTAVSSAVALVKTFISVTATLKIE